MDGSHGSEVRRGVFRLHNWIADLEALYMQSEGVETDETAALAAYVEQATEESVEDLCDLLAYVDGLRALGKQRAEQLRAMSDRCDRLETFGKRALIDLMSKLEKRSMDAGTYSVSLVAGRDVALCDADFFDIGTLPDDLVRVVPEKREPEKAKILAALKAGREVKGYILSKTATGVRIR